METEQINVFFCFALLSLQTQQRGGGRKVLVSFTNMSILIWPYSYCCEHWLHNGRKRKIRAKYEGTWQNKWTTGQNVSSGIRRQ